MASDGAPDNLGSDGLLQRDEQRNRYQLGHTTRPDLSPDQWHSSGTNDEAGSQLPVLIAGCDARPDARLGEWEAGRRVAPRISSLLIKPASALCNLACGYCFY